MSGSGCRASRSGAPVATPVTPPVDDHLRCTDAERAHAVDVAKRACADGRITLDDFGQRVDAIWASATYGELRAVLSDIPAELTTSPVGSPPPKWVRAWRPYIVVMVGLVAIWLLSTPGGYFWPIWPALGWGLPLVLKHRHGRYAVASHGPAHWELPIVP
jgi:uncharacterized protein DUF1707/2TM domain-containing protein